MSRLLLFTYLLGLSVGLTVISSALAAGGVERQNGPRGLRLIAVATEGEAEAIRARIEAGEPFDLLAREYSVDPTARAGGYLGSVELVNLNRAFQEALENLPAGEVSPVTRTGRDYVLLQWLTEAEEVWMSAIETGTEAFEGGRLTEARRHFIDAIDAAEGFGADDHRLARSLGLLGAVNFSSGRLAGAESAYRRSLEIYDRILGPEDPALIQPLNDLALTLYRLGRNLPETENLFARSLKLVEAAFGPGHVDTARALSNLAMARRDQGRYAEARELLERSLSIVEQLGRSQESEVALTLGELAELNRREGDLAEAAAAASRALDISERIWGRDHAALGAPLNDLARIHLEQGNFDEAASLYERTLSIRWGTPRAGPATRDVVQVLDAFTDALIGALSDLDASAEAFGAYERLLETASVHEDLFVAMADVFLNADLFPEAGRVMRTGLTRYPDSVALRYELGETYAASQVAQQALEVFRGIPAASSSAQGLILPRIGDMLAFLLEHDEARRVYEEALAIDPDNVEARLSLSNLEFELNRHAEALEGYTRVLGRDPDNLTALRRLAEVNLLLGRHEEALDAAGRALEIDPTHVRTHYVRGIALRNLGRLDEAQVSLQEYQRLQTDSEARDLRVNEIGAASAAAAQMARNGAYADALAALQSTLDAYPDADLLLLNMGLLEANRGLHQEAIDALERRVSLGVPGDFPVHAILAREYAAIGNPGASRRNRARYLEKIGGVLEASIR